MQTWEAQNALPKHTLSICLDKNYFLAPLEDKVHYSQDPQPLYSEKNIKNGSHDTHLKIILVQCFLFSIFSEISCIQTNHRCTFTTFSLYFYNKIGRLLPSF